MSYRIGVDIGGTFTDFALIDDRDGRVATYKRLTSPEDPSLAVIDGVSAILRENNCEINEVSTIIHGTTLVTNAVIERKGANIGMLVTSGFRDTLEIGKERRYDLYDLRLDFPAPLVVRGQRVEVNERIRHDGTVVEPPKRDEVLRTLAYLVEECEVEAIAVCLLHSYLNPQHEEAIAGILAERYPNVYTSISSDGFSVIREYERWTTTTMNAYVQPMVDRYLARLEERLQKIAFKGNLLIMSSSGGTLTPQTARRFPVRMLESGPAAGALMSADIGRSRNMSRLLSFDMGGTTAKGALVLGAAPLKKYELEVARVHEFKKGSGLLVRIPVIDMIEIGAGGGSIAAVDDRGLIRVGPRSAGAKPGPACYRLGGDEATLTDANLMLGYLDPQFFLGGRMAIDPDASEAAVMRRLGAPLNLTALRAAWGIHELINEDVARAFRVHASERGVDYRSCGMVAFGGSGPLHAIRIAQKLKIPRVILPPGAGVMSALGMLVSPLSFEVIRFHRVTLKELDHSLFSQLFSAIEAEACAVLAEAGIAREEITVTRTLDMRYVGQGYEIEVHLPDDILENAPIDRLCKLYSENYRRLFSISFSDKAVEIVNWKVEAIGPLPTGAGTARITGFVPKASALKGERLAYFPEGNGLVSCPVYDRYSMAVGMEINGPALIEERESTAVVGVGARARVDDMRNIITEL